MRYDESCRRWSVGLVPALLGLSACSVESNAAPPTRLRVGTAVEMRMPTPLDLEGLSAMAHDLVFRGPFREDEHGQLLPELIDEPAWSADGFRLTLRVRQGSLFSDGAAVTAADIVGTYQAARDKKGWGSGDISSMRAVDERTVEVVLPRPFDVPDSLTLGVMEQGKPAAIGAGAYIVADKADDHLDLVANSRYGGPRPGISEIRFQRLPSAAEGWSNELAGLVDLVTFVPSNKYEMLRQIPTVHPVRVLTSTVAVLQLRAPPPPFDRPEVRRALALAIDRDELVRTVLRESALPALGPVWPGSTAFDRTLEPYGHDPREARRLLVAAGCEELADGTMRWQGAPLEIVITAWIDDADTEEIARAVQDYLDGIGITVRFRPAGNEDLYIAAVRGTGPLNVLRLRHGSKDPFVDLDAMALVPAPTPLPRATASAVEQASRDLQRRLRDEAPSIYLVWMKRVDVIDRRFCGLPAVPDSPEGRLDQVHPCAPGEER